MIFQSLIFILVLFNQDIISFSQTTFSDFKAEMQINVKVISDQMAEIYSNRCNSTIFACQKKSYNFCEGTASKQCVNHFPTPGGCVSGGASLALTSAVRFPNTTNPNILSEQERQFVCTSAQLQATFQNLSNINNGRFTFSYFGTSLGSFRNFPTITQQKDGNGNCQAYDPRFRPWYVTGSSSGKNVILMIDTSGSMANNNRMKTAISAAKAVLKTFSNNDFVGIIKFSSNASTLSSNQIKRATSVYKKQLEQKINQLSPQGSTNYESAFDLGFNMLNQVQADQFGSPCSSAQNIFLFLTDGSPTIGQSTLSGLKVAIDKRNVNYNIKLFTYGMDTDLAIVNSTLLKQLACLYNGIYFSVPSTASSSQLLTLMRSYYQYIAQGVNITHPQWTQPYQDAFGFGNVITVSFPAYYTENGVRKILGVAGLDVSVDYVTKTYSMSIEQMQKQLLNSILCYASTLTDCGIQALRPASTKCGFVGCSTEGSQNACSSIITTDIFLTLVDSNSNICCGLAVNALIGIVIGILTAIIISIIVITCILKKMKAKRQQLQKMESIYRSQKYNQILIQYRYGSVIEKCDENKKPN